MEVSEVKIKVVPRANNKLKAFATVTFDNAFVVKDIRVIQGLKGMIVAMPAKKLTFRCFKCGFKNPLRARFCSECGRRVRATQSRRNPQTGRPVLQVDIAHPINPETRKMIEDKILEAYEKEFDKVKDSIAAQIGEAVGGEEFAGFEVERPAEGAAQGTGESPEAPAPEEAPKVEETPEEAPKVEETPEEAPKVEETPALAEPPQPESEPEKQEETPSTPAP